MNTPFFQHLEKRRTKLESAFLDFHDKDSVMDENQDKLRAFKVLMHAELEHYFESIAKDCFDFARNDWTSFKKLNPILFNILFYSYFPFSGNVNTMDFSERMNCIFNHFENHVKNNNGIKSDNIVKLFVPLGIDFPILDQSWIATLDSYGMSRGFIAHNSFSVQKPLYKPDEHNKINIIFQGLKEFDQKVIELKTGKNYPIAFN